MCNDDIQAEIHTAEPLVPEPSVFEVELTTEELKCKKSSEIKHRVEQFAIRSINLLFLVGKRRNCLRSGRRRRAIGRAIKQTAVFIGAYKYCTLHTKFCPTSCCKG